MADANPIKRRGCGRKATDLLGKKFSRLTVIRRMANNKYKQAQWLCRCDCGPPFNFIKVIGGRLRSGHTQSCGCLRKERTAEIKTLHGHKRRGKQSRTYSSWSGAKNRCTNPNNNAWKNYGGRGISMCDRWLHSFENFLADMGEKPPGMSLDRYPDNDGDYEPENCRWATAKQQTRNSRSARLIEFEGKSRCLQEWAGELNITPDTLSNRLQKWPLERALTQRTRLRLR